MTIQIYNQVEADICKAMKIKHKCNIKRHKTATKTPAKKPHTGEYKTSLFIIMCNDKNTKKLFTNMNSFVIHDCSFLQGISQNLKHEYLQLHNAD